MGEMGAEVAKVEGEEMAEQVVGEAAVEMGRAVVVRVVEREGATEVVVDSEAAEDEAVDSEVVALATFSVTVL